MSDSLPTVPETETQYPTTITVKPEKGFVEELRRHPDDTEFIAGLLDDARGPKGRPEMDMKIRPNGKVVLSGTIFPKKAAARVRATLLT